MYKMDWDVRFYNDKEYQLGMVAEIEIDSSVDNLTDTVTIVLPEAYMNAVFDFQQKISRGTRVVIQLGYDGNLKTEFIGYIQHITTNESTLKIICEDALFLFRKGVKDVELKPTSMPKIAQLIIDQIDRSYILKCDYDIAYEKFVIHQATGFDVLKKLQEETKANIYFNMDKKELHIHPPYVEKGGEVNYSMQHNIERSSLQYKMAIDKRIEVTVESINLEGKVQSYTTGTTGGDKITIKVGSMNAVDAQKVANAELLRKSADSYDGSIDTWLLPMVRPTYSATIKDQDYPHKDGRYYVVGVKTTFSENGGKRTVKLGVKLK